jgi:hypothetical protein
MNAAHGVWSVLVTHLVALTLTVAAALALEPTVASAQAVDTAPPFEPVATEPRAATPHHPTDVQLEEAAPNPYLVTDTLVPVGLGFAGLHAIDNIIVGRTFTGDTVLPTLVQLTYVGAAVAYALDAGPLFWMAFSTILLTAHSIGHLFIGSSADHISTFYDLWATGDNRSDARSPAIGRISQGVLVGLDLTFLAVLVSSIVDGVRCGFTIVQEPNGSC